MSNKRTLTLTDRRPAKAEHAKKKRHASPLEQLSDIHVILLYWNHEEGQWLLKLPRCGT